MNLIWNSGDRLLPVDADYTESPFPTLQEADEMANKKLRIVHGNELDIPKTNNPKWKSTENESQASTSYTIENKQTVDSESTPTTYIGHQIPEDFLKKVNLLNNDNENEIQPLYKLNDDGTTIGNRNS